MVSRMTLKHSYQKKAGARPHACYSPLRAVNRRANFRISISWRSSCRCARPNNHAAHRAICLGAESVVIGLDGCGLLPFGDDANRQ